jgi:DNA-binding MarR family transcriptional regulator
MRISDVRELVLALDRLTMWLRRQAPSPVSASTIAALDRLHTDGPLRVSDLARLESMTQPGVTMLVHRLADAGYAERVPDPTDRRAALVRITPAGADVLADRRKARAEVLRHCLAQLGDDDQHLLEAALPAIERLISTDPSVSTRN